MAFKIGFLRGGAPVLHMRCPRCHHNSGFSVAGIQQPSSGVVRILLSCRRVYTTIRRHQDQCGYVIAFDGVIK